MRKEKNLNSSSNICLTETINATQPQAIVERNERYGKYVNTISPKTSMLKSLWNSFWVGGIICCIGQGLGDLYMYIFPEMGLPMIANLTSMTLITVAILFTGLGFYDVMARVGGAGSFLPITGFANAISSASMEYKAEGLIMGTSVKMFNVVGPVIVNGIVWSAVAGIVNLLIMGGL